MNAIVHEEKGAYRFSEARNRARRHVAYYEEGLLVETAARLIGAMERKGVARGELARRLDVSPAYVTKVLRGQANLSLVSLARLAFALNLRWECILLPQDAQVGLLSLVDGEGGCSICHVENPIVESPPLNEDVSEDAAYARGTQIRGTIYEQCLSA